MAGLPFLFTVGTTQYDFREVLTALPFSGDPTRVVVTFDNGQGPLNLDLATFNALRLAALNSTGNPPTGSAGGDLTGTFPNPTIATVQGASPSAAGLAILSAADAAAQRVAIGLNTAGGDLSGTLPSPTVAKVAGVTPGVTGLVVLATASAAAARTAIGITPANAPTIVPLVWASTVNINASLGTLFSVTITDDTTFATPTNPVDGQRITIEVTQGGSGSNAISFAGSNFTATTTNVLPSVSTALGSTCWLYFRYSALHTKWYADGANIGGA